MGRTSARFSGALALLVGLVLVSVASIAFGSWVVPLSTLWDALWSHDQTIIAEWNNVWTARLPRTVLGLLVGAAIGLAGALTQGFTRNPMADPGLLGVNAGAACSVVIGVYILRITTPIQYMFFGMIGAVIAASLVFFLASVGPGASPLTLILAGTGLTVLLTAITSAIVLIDTQSLDAWRFWQVGGTAGRGWDVVYATMPFLCVGAILAVVSGYFLNVLALGEDSAHALGANVTRARVVGIVAITLLIGAATAACGPIVFLGLLAPHIARFITGPDYRWIVPYSALIGAVTLVGCDVIGRVIARPGEVQTGIVIAAVGAPFFIGLVQMRKPVSV